MGFNKFANAQLVTPSISVEGWGQVRDRSQADTFSQREATRVVLQEYNPSEFMLTHCTIVASVDSEPGPGKLGAQVVDGFQINRKFQDYYITPKTAKYVNNNFDSWERKLLLSSFRTFIGGQNYVEHIQLPELSKGRIVDAAARDIGDSIYIDILIATNLKHRPLIQAIKTGNLKTLSMGCTVSHTLCTKCGNVAYDETQLCPHIRYMKGQTFIDANGQKRVISELCGHIADEPGSVKFIEASWVANPAFRGAVLRNILSQEEVALLGGKMATVFSFPAPKADPSKLQKAANLAGVPSYVKAVLAQEFGMPEQETPPPAPKEESDPIQKVVDDLANTVREQLVKKLRSEIGKQNAADIQDANTNDTLIKSAIEFPEWKAIAKKVASSTRDPKLAKKVIAGLLLYRNGGWQELVKTGNFSGKDLLAVARVLDLLTNRTVVAGESRIYRTVLAVGGMGRFDSIKSYLAACRQVVGRDLSKDEVASLIEKGRLFTLGS